MKKVMFIFILSIILVGGVAVYNIMKQPKGIVPENGLVPDEETAIKIAEAIWYPIYGDAIEESRPFEATYIEKEKAWSVRGYLPENMVGGVPEILIRKQDGKILYVNHGM